MFQPVEGAADFPSQEKAILKFWRENKIYDKSLAQREGSPDFVFYEGPPTANGMPHPGHCLTRAIKDLFPRYRTMRGDRCERKAGWDTHGLPVEVEVCKELGIHSKEDIEQYGVEPFIQLCQKSVWRYMKEWERLTERLGFWIHMDEAYVTYHQSYVESVWWSLKTLFDRGLLYQGHKIVWWWAQGGTALSAGEVGQGYREVADPSVFVKFPLLDDNGNETDNSLLVWTTTPWTLPSNQFAAVNPEIEYSLVVDKESDAPYPKMWIASSLVESISGKVKRELIVEKTCKGSALVGQRYAPPFSFFCRDDGDKLGRLNAGGESVVAWRVVSADFVTTESGSGIVHQAPAFGEVDFDVLVAEQARFIDGDGPELINAVAPDGTFTEVTRNAGPDGLKLEGRWVKDCDKDITRDLKHRGLLFHQEQYLHDYPFCWRAEEDPLIQYPRESWFIRTTSVKNELIQNNQEINWLPTHIKDGRFGNFLESNVDWALSRERYWGTPLPIWICEETGYQEAIGSYEELQSKPGVAGIDVWEKAKAENPELPDDLQVHKPYIDAITYDSPKADGARMRRVPEVIDCWYDSGAMPFAQFGWRGEESGEAADHFYDQFPADFISEAIDQTRGWFYSQLAISTLLFGEGRGSDNSNSARKNPIFPYPHPFRNCIVLGLMLGEDGQKMSKSKRNYREPNEIFDRFGADALRWYLFANQPPWTGIRYSEQAIKDSIPEFLLRLWNVYSFFVIYANIDQFDPAAEIGGDAAQLSSDVLSKARDYRPLSERREIDRWILSELNRTCRDVEAAMDSYDNFGACQVLTDFVDGLSNWYVRSTRERFWMKDKTAPDKRDAYWTLYECLIATSKLIAPFVPFVAETFWQNLARSGFGDRVRESVHLCDYPTSAEDHIDALLAARMALGREISSLGRAARNNANIKVRQPLSKVEIVLADLEHVDWLKGHAALIENELNVKSIEFTTRGEEYITYSVVPNFKRLGPRVGKQMPIVKKLLSEADGAALLANFKSTGSATLELPNGGKLELDEDDIEVRLAAKDGWAAAQGKQCVVVLATELTDSLVQEGLARDVIRFVQDCRKDIGCAYTDRITLHFIVDDAFAQQALQLHSEFIARETLADEIYFHAHESPDGARHRSRAAEKYDPIGFVWRDSDIDVNVETTK